MLDLFFCYTHCHRTVFLFAHHCFGVVFLGGEGCGVWVFFGVGELCVCVVQLRQALVRGKRRMIWLHQRCHQPVWWVFSYLSRCGECLCVKNQRVNTTPFKEQPPENQNPAPCRYELCHSNQSLPCTEGKRLAHMQQPHPSSLHINCSGPAVLMTARKGLGLTKSQEIAVSGKQFPSPQFPSLNKSKISSPWSLFVFFFNWGLSSNEHTQIFTVWGCFFFPLTLLLDLWNFSWW